MLTLQDVIELGHHGPVSKKTLGSSQVASLLLIPSVPSVADFTELERGELSPKLQQCSLRTSIADLIFQKRMDLDDLCRG